MASTSDHDNKCGLTWKLLEGPKPPANELGIVKKAKSNSKEIVPPIPQDLLSRFKYRNEEIKSAQEKQVTRRAMKNPMVPLGMLATTGCLIGMIYTSIKRDRMKTQYFMRGRIAAQFFTFCALFGGAWYLTNKDNNEDMSV